MRALGCKSFLRYCTNPAELGQITASQTFCESYCHDKMLFHTAQPQAGSLFTLLQGSTT